MALKASIGATKVMWYLLPRIVLSLSSELGFGALKAHTQNLDSLDGVTM